MPCKLHSKGRRHIPGQRLRVTNWREYDASLGNCGSLTIRFAPEVIAGWKAQPRTTPGGQRHYSDLAIETALTLRAVFRLALRQSEGLIGSIMKMLEIALPAPDHTTLSRRACGLPVCDLARIGTGELHLIVDSTGLKLRGAGEWLFEKHGTTKRRAWRKLHIGIDAGNGEIVASDLTDKDGDDASHVPTLLDQLTQDPTSFMADGACDRAATYDAILARNPSARFIVPPCKGSVPGPTATISPTQRDLHVLAVDEHGWMNWQKASGYNTRSKVEAAISRYKRVIGDTLKSRHDTRRATEVAIAIKSLNRMNQLGRAIFTRIGSRLDVKTRLAKPPCNKVKHSLDHDTNKRYLRSPYRARCRRIGITLCLKTKGRDQNLLCKSAWEPIPICTTYRSQETGRVGSRQTEFPSSSIRVEFCGHGRHGLPSRSKP